MQILRYSFPYAAVVFELLLVARQVGLGCAAREDAWTLTAEAGGPDAPAEGTADVDPALKDACNIKEAVKGSEGSASGNPAELLPKLKQCTAALETFAEKVQAGRDASAEANKAYMEQFKAVMEELKQLKDVERLKTALKADQQEALKVLIGEADQVTNEIDLLVKGIEAPVSTATPKVE
mmetsp:Transcript_95763/g.249503  ORF Transcript_95763/g.249503 Transcript_95763/m.249503 type:complete len:180 (+) Transcript_95763:132-671(+)